MENDPFDSEWKIPLLSLFFLTSLLGTDASLLRNTLTDLHFCSQGNIWTNRVSRNIKGKL